MKHQILIVEDRADTLDHLQRFLSEKFKDLKVQGAMTLTEAKKLIGNAATSDTPYDIAVLDFKLPSIEGGPLETNQSLYHQIRENMRDTVVVHTTAYPHDSQFMEHILDEVMRSPVGPRSVFLSKLEPDWAIKLSSIIEQVLKNKPTITTLPKKVFLSCFISYSHHDEEFVGKIYSQLKKEGIEVWYAPAAMKPGVKLHEEIANAVRVYDKLLLVLSEHSMKSNWVATEIRIALDEEKKSGLRKLIPIRLVSFDVIQAWSCFNADIGKDMAVELREYFIPDFSCWSDKDSLEAAIKSLVKGLKA